MEIAFLFELVTKAAIGIILKEVVDGLKSSLKVGESEDTDTSKLSPSIEALMDLNLSLEAENKFKSDQIDDLRERLLRVQSQLPSGETTK